MTNKETINELTYKEALRVLKDHWIIRYWQWFNDTLTTAAEDIDEILKTPTRY